MKSGFEDKPVLKAKYRNRTEIIAPASVLEAAKCVMVLRGQKLCLRYLSYE